MKKRTVVASLCTAALASVGIAVAPASASESPPSNDLPIRDFSTVAEHLFTPLSFDVDSAGNAYVAQNFAGTLSKISPKGKQTTVATAPDGWELGAVSELRGTVYYVQGLQEDGQAQLMVLPKRGEPRQVADLGAYESSVNPDQGNTYGFSGLSDECAASFDPFGPAGPASYQGIVDVHPYASVATRDGVYVADAAGNDILHVSDGGTISTVAVLPPTPALVVTGEMASMYGFPDCAVGHGYRFESVPTDIEVGPNGWLYVTSLPGGPEDASLGARGAVYKVSPNSGAIETVATGLVGATGLAVDDRLGVVLVAEMFGGPDGTGQISMILPSSEEVVASMPMTSPASIELNHDKIYATINAFVPDEMGAPQATGQLVVAKGASRLFHLAVR